MKTPKKLLAACSALSLALTLVGCGGSGDSSGPASADGGCLAEAKKSGKLVVGTVGNLPMDTIDPETGEATGIIPEILQDFAKAEGIKTVEPVAMEFGSLIPSMQSKRIVMSADSMYRTEEREQAIDFTDRLWYGPEVMIVKEGNPESLSNFDDLGPDNSIATYTGTAWVDWLAELKENNGVQTKTYKTPQNVMSAVASGQIQAGVLTAYVAGYALKTKPNSGFEFAEGYKIADKEAVQDHLGVRKGCKDLIDAFNSHYAGMVEDGTLNAMMEEWGLTPVEYYLKGE